MDINVISEKTGRTKKASLSIADGVFARDFNMPLVHQVVVAEQNAWRSGTKAQKSRAEVQGGGAKPWRQKGTGRARAGTSRSPLWRSGGVTFAAKNRYYQQKVNRKMYRAALCSLISELLRNGTLIVCDDFSIEQPKTKFVLEKLKKLKVDEALLVVASFNENLYYACRNLYAIGSVEAQTLSVYQLLQYKQVIVTQSALAILEQRLSHE